ncbi:MAG: hypothetical protein KBG07_00680 [Elusimicrobia bacterium]|nr:hypothetical protein [Elusimicrobiota bacterium]MBP9127266.1 hypothetical protein [Elusimicrobiota bacterium]
MKKANSATALLFLLLFAGCASFRLEPFQSFEHSVISVSQSLETEMARDVEWTREADVEALAETKNAPLSEYMLNEVKGYGWSTAVTSPHWEARLMLRALEELNAGFLGYTQLLTQVAQGPSTEPEGNAALAAAINQSLRDAEATLGRTKNKPTLFPAGVAACSTESLIQVKRHGRAKTLRAVVQKNQSWVESYAAHCLALLDVIRADLKAAYANRTEAIHARWDDKRTPGRNTLARSIFNMNAEYADAMDSLKALSLFYNNLPKAHDDLADSLVRRATPSKALADLAATADQVARRTHDLEKSR